MTIEKAIGILTPGGVAKNPAEYEAAHKMAVLALGLIKCNTTLRTAVEVENVQICKREG